MERDESAPTLVLASAEREVERRVAREIAVDAVEARVVGEREDVEQVAQVEPLREHVRVHAHRGAAAELDLPRGHLVGALVLLRLDVLEREDLRLARLDLGVHRRDVAERHARDREAVDATVAAHLGVAHRRAHVDLHVRGAGDRNARERRDVREAHVRVTDLDAELVREPEEHEAAVDVRVREIGVGVLELHRVGPHGEVRAELGLGEADEALPRRVLHPFVPDGEVLRRRREVAVELERVELARKIGHVDVDDVPAHVRVLRDAERDHERREIDVLDVRRGAERLRERLDVNVLEVNGAARELHDRLRALDDVVTHRELGVEVVREAIAVDADATRGDPSAHLGHLHRRGEANVRVDADPALDVG